MLGNLIRHNSMILAGFALLAISIVPYPIAAYGAPQSTHIDLYQNIWINPGLARGQTMRYTWTNQNDPELEDREFEPLRIRVRLLAADRSLIAQTEAPAVGVGQFQFFDFNRDGISLPGEALTGRLQTRLEVMVSGVKYRNVILKQAIVESFEDTIEIIDNVSGRTTVSTGGGANEMSLDDTAGKEKLDPDGFQIISAGKDYLVGFVPGETLRVSSLNSFDPSVGDGRKFKMLFAVTVFLADGSAIAESDEITLDPGEFHYFDFKRADLPITGEPGGRVQARVLFHKLRLKAAFPSSVEIVDETTGKTTVFISQKPKEIVVVGSR